MFDGYIFTESSLANVEVDGETIGFEMRTRIPYYRGVPLSMVHDVEVEVDGQAVDLHLAQPDGLGAEGLDGVRGVDGNPV